MTNHMETGGTESAGWGPLSSFVKSIADGLRRQLSAAARRREMAQEFANLTGGELDRLLRDFGLAPGDLGLFIARAPYSRELLDGMVTRLEIPQDALNRDPAVRRDVERHCAICDAQRQCRRWLARRGDGLGYHRFCSNAETFDALVEKPR